MSEKEETKTIKQWEEEYGCEILDADGFDRSDPNLYKKEFTREEFERGLGHCTLLLNMDSKIFDLWELRVGGDN